MLQKSFAKKQVSRICKNTIVTAIFCICIITIFIFLNGTNITNLYLSPIKSGDAETITALYKQDKTCVSIQVDELFYTGWDHTTDGKVTSSYYMYDAGDMYILCEMPKKFTEDTYNNFKLTGVVSKFSKIDRDVLWEISGEAAEANELTRYETDEWFASVKIDATKSILWMQVIYGIGLLLIAFCLFKIVSSIYYIGNYQKHKAYRNLTKDNYTPERLDEQLTADLESNLLLKSGAVTITENWIISTTPYKVTVRYMDELVWAYKVVTKHRTNGIPTGKTYSVNLAFSDRTSLSLVAKNVKEADNRVEELWNIIPKLVVGYSPELADMYQKDMPAFLQLRDNAKNPVEQPPVEQVPVEEPSMSQPSAE